MEKQTAKEHTKLTKQVTAANLENEVTRARLQLSMTQEAFAQLLDTPIGTIRGWEQGRRQPPPYARVLIRVAVKYPDKVLECSAHSVAPQVKASVQSAVDREVESVETVEAQLHHSGDDTDFWLL